MMKKMAVGMAAALCVALSAPLGASAGTLYDSYLYFSKSLGGAGVEQLRAVAATPDGGYVAAGNSAGPSDHWRQGDASSSAALIVKYSESGAVLWALDIVTVSGAPAVLEGVAALTDGNIVAVGYAFGESDYWGMPAGGKSDAIVLKLTANGQVIKGVNLGADGADSFRGVAPAPGGGFVAVGESDRANGALWGNEGETDGIMVRFGPDLGVVWSLHLGGEGVDALAAIGQLTGGGYAVAGSSNAASARWGNAGGYDGVVAAVGADGAVAWAQNIGDGKSERITGIAATEDGFAAVGVSASGAQTGGLIARYSLGGARQYANTTGIAGNTRYNGVAQAPDGTLIVAGASGVANAPYWGNNGGDDAIVVRYTADGRIASGRNYGGSGGDQLFQVAMQGGGRHSAVGLSNSAVSDSWVNRGASDAIVLGLATDYVVTEAYVDTAGNSLGEPRDNLVFGGRTYGGDPPTSLEGKPLIGYSINGGPLVSGAPVISDIDSDARVTLYYGGIHLVREDYLDERGNAIRMFTEAAVGYGDGYSKAAPAIEGWNYVGYRIGGGALQRGDTVTILPVLGPESVSYVYRSENPDTGGTAAAPALIPIFGFMAGAFVTAGIALKKQRLILK